MARQPVLLDEADGASRCESLTRPRTRRVLLYIGIGSALLVVLLGFLIVTTLVATQRDGRAIPNPIQPGAGLAVPSRRFHCGRRGCGPCPRCSRRTRGSRRTSS